MRPLLTALALFALAAVALLPGAASAEPLPQLWQTGSSGSGAGQTLLPRGIAANPNNGRVYVADQSNNRIVEFTALGDFVKAWGWGVIASGTNNDPRNEIQEVSVDATGGSFKLRLRNGSGSRLSASIPFDASAAVVKSALEAIGPSGGAGPSLSPGDVAVTGPIGGPWSIEFTGALADADIFELEISNSTLTGGAGAAVATTQPGANFEVCIPEDGDVCRGGQPGAAAGHIESPQGIALDSGGNVYAVNRSNNRVQKFSPTGEPLLMFGGDVNKTKVESGVATEAEENLCPVDPGDECQAGVRGSGQGQFGTWAVGSFIAITPDDKVYVGDQDRIQRFDTGGAYQDEISLPGKTVQSLAVDSAGDLYAIYNGQPDVRKITPAGTELVSPRFVVTDPNGAVVNPTAVAVGAGGEVYAFGPVSFSAGVRMDPIFAFDAAGVEIDNWGRGEFDGSTGLATNLCAGSEAPGNLFVTNLNSANAFVRAYGTDPNGCLSALTDPATDLDQTVATLNGTVIPRGLDVTNCHFQYGPTDSYGQTVDCEQSSAEIGTGGDPVAVSAELTDLDPGTVYHFRLRASFGGGQELGTDATFKTFGPPLVGDEHTASVEETEATVAATLNPEGLDTSYHVQYGPTDSYGQLTPAQGLGSERAENPVTVELDGLEPGQTFHWRIVAINAGGVTEGADRAFTTYRPEALDTDCPNQAFRTGPGASLPDCRAYEMVSPIDKGGQGIISGRGIDGGASGYFKVAPDGGRFTYTAPGSFAGQPNRFDSNQYLATRDAAQGWSSQGIHPPVTGRAAGSVLFGLIRPFMAFTPDLCAAWLIDFQTPAPTADGQPDYRNLYRRQNCAPGAGGLEALTPAPPPLPAGTGEQYVTNDAVQGVSDDGRHAFFVAAAKLTPEAADGTIDQVYDRFDGRLALVSVLPDGAVGDPAPGDGSGFADPSQNVVGSGWAGYLANAASSDGSRVYWTSGISSVAMLGRIYLRLNPELGIADGECSTPAKPCTLEVSAGNGALFWAAAADGSRALYSEGEELYEFDLATESRRLVAAGFEGVSGTSDDLSRIYFVSREALTGPEQNSEGDQAQAGDPNLYLEREGELSFIATLIESDLGVAEPDANFPAYELAPPAGAGGERMRTTRVTPAGDRIVFQSRALLTGVSNTDAVTGKPAVEVFTYEAGGELLCVSCNPSGARPIAGDLRAPYDISTGRLTRTNVVAAAWIPASQQPLHSSNVISDEGNRIFFSSHDRLLPRDQNGVQDVYQWEAADSGSCEIGDPDYFEPNGGCLHLISSAQSSRRSDFWDATPSGDDVFITTDSRLVDQDPGLVDLYDARVGGGFAQPPAQVAPCEGEACRGASPELPPPVGAGSAVFEGLGDQVQSFRRNCSVAAKRAQRLNRAARALRKRARSTANPKQAKRLRSKAAKRARKAKAKNKSARRCRANANRGAAR